MLFDGRLISVMAAYAATTPSHEKTYPEAQPTGTSLIENSETTNTNSYTAAIETIKILKSCYNDAPPISPKKKHTTAILDLSSPLDTEKSAGKKRAKF